MFRFIKVESLSWVPDPRSQVCHNLLYKAWYGVLYVVSAGRHQRSLEPTKSEANAAIILRGRSLRHKTLPRRFSTGSFDSVVVRHFQICNCFESIPF